MLMRALLPAILWLGLTSQTYAAELPKCSPDDLSGVTMAPYQSVAEHRLFTPEPITYKTKAAGQQFGFRVASLVDATGRPVCISEMAGNFGSDDPLTPLQTAYLPKLSAWRYEPFLVDGHPAGVLVTEVIHEQVLPLRHLPMPKAPPSETSVSVARGACFGPCPIFKVAVSGDGRVEYEGGGFIDVAGKHSYTIPQEKAAALIHSIWQRDLWSMDESYQASITDQSASYLTLKAGKTSKSILDYVGEMVGMPVVITLTEEEIFEASGASDLINLTSRGVDILRSEGFDFTSEAGADLFANAVSNPDTTDNPALLELLQSGVSLNGKVQPRYGEVPGSVLDEALKNRRAILIAPLIAQGAILTDGHIDQVKLDSAFQAAIIGGRLAEVQAIWQAGGDLHPSLTYVDTDQDDHHTTVPVILLLSRRDDAEWEGVAIAQWLAAQGCDLKATRANGDTLLHIAADPGDPNFVRFLLEQGFDPNAPGQYGLAIGGTQNEEVALILLEAGTDVKKMDDKGAQFRRYAEYRNWTRVLAWLDAHDTRP